MKNVSKIFKLNLNFLHCKNKTIPFLTKNYIKPQNLNLHKSHIAFKQYCKRNKRMKVKIGLNTDHETKLVVIVSNFMLVLGLKQKKKRKSWTGKFFHQWHFYFSTLKTLRRDEDTAMLLRSLHSTVDQMFIDFYLLIC